MFFEPIKLKELILPWLLVKMILKHKLGKYWRFFCALIEVDKLYLHDYKKKVARGVTKMAVEWAELIKSDFGLTSFAAYIFFFLFLRCDFICQDTEY